MKSFIIFSLLILPLFFKSSIYDLQIETAQGQLINMSQFKGKKILIASVSPEILETNKLSFLDSIQDAYPTIVVIAVPAKDFGGNRNEEIVATAKNAPTRKIILTPLADVKKSKASVQHPLLRWLTDASANTHFDADAETDDQLYVVSESGVLYAVLQKGVPAKVIDQVLEQQNIKE